LSDGFEGSGISSDEIVELRIWYPSMRAVRGHGIGNGNHRVVILNLVGVRSHTDDTKLMYRLLLDLSNFPNSQPSAFVLSPRDEDIKHVNIGNGSFTNLVPNRKVCSICLGGGSASAFTSWPRERLTRMRGFLNHLENVLNTPNTASRARG